ncbi:MAG: tRNA (guanosine(46)-N7)-methyltransferase TrmB [Helicobacteraceae bacterium]|jgi:tRNA (guanine-N7-)-methyltransferase|nr:tRNA (guanosine(46)-N7)-methyltransferase TrmB [Helicobacteraceae bacterium]
MPHLIVENFCPFKTPQIAEGVLFAFASKGANGICSAELEGRRFLLRWFERRGRTILKTDKATRPPLLNTVKLALQTLARISNATIISRAFDRLKTDTKVNLFEPNDFISALKHDTELWIEVGFGSGRHILHNAKHATNKLHLGIETHRPSAEQLLKRAKDERLSNIAVIVSDARAFISALPTASTERVFVHFPVPWDDSPYRRIFNGAFAQETLRVLKRGGQLELRTDSKNYHETARKLLETLKNVDLQTQINEEAAISSKYEDRWRRLDRDIYDLKMTNLQERKWSVNGGDFSFHQTVSADRAIKKLERLLLMEDEMILKTDRCWLLTSGGALFRFIFGATRTPQTVYLKVEDNNAAYYPFAPLCSPQNLIAHTALLKVLYG